MHTCRHCFFHAPPSVSYSHHFPLILTSSSPPSLPTHTPHLQLVTGAGEKLLIVDYSTTWCGPCKMMAPKFDEMSNRFDAVFVKVIGDSTPEAGQLLKREGVRSVPAFHFWKNGKRVDSISGADPERLEDVILQNV